MSTVVRNIFSNWVGVAVSLAVAFLLSPFLVHSLGDRAYGLWVLVLSVTGYMGLLDTGLRVAIVKQTAECNARNDAEGLNRTLFAGLALYGCLSIAVVLLSMLAALCFDRIFTVSAEEASVGRVLVFMAGLNVALSLPLGIFGGLLAGLQRYDLLNRATIVVLLLRTAAIVISIRLGFQLIALGWIHIAGQLVTAALLVHSARREFPDLDLTPRRLEWPTVASLYGYGGYVILNNLAMFLLFYSGEVLIGMFVGTAAVTSYAIARSLVQYLSTLIGSMTQVFHPYASDQHSRGNAEAVRDALFIGTKSSLLIALPIGVAYLLVGSTFIELWMGHGYGRTAGSLLVLLTVPQVLWLSQSTAGNILLGVGRHRLVAMLNVITGLAGIALGAVLARRFGATGVALGMGIPIMVTQSAILPWLTARALGLGFADYIAGAYLGPALAAAPFGLVLYALSHFWPPRNLAAFAVQVGAALAVFLPAAYFLAFAREERARWTARFRPARPLANEAS